MTERWRRAAAGLALGGMLATAQAAVLEQESRQLYDVHQQPGTSLLQALNAASPVRESGQVFHGYTHWQVDWHFRYRPGPDGLCRITSVETRLVVKMTLPQLRTATPDVADAFARYLPALVAHEEGHRDIGRDTARQIDEAIAQLPRQAACEQLAAEANRVARAAIQRGTQANQDYDASTRHGCTQGACLTR